MFELFLTEIIVGGFLTIFAFAVRTWAANLSKDVFQAVNKIERIAERVQSLEVENATSIAKLDAHISGIYKRLDRELPNGGR